MVHVIFEYKDKNNGEWKRQSCTVRSVEECKKTYDLGTDKQRLYRIIKVEEV